MRKPIQDSANRLTRKIGNRSTEDVVDNGAVDGVTRTKTGKDQYDTKKS